jgi:hypothetical protein
MYIIKPFDSDLRLFARSRLSAIGLEEPEEALPVQGGLVGKRVRVLILTKLNCRFCKGIPRLLDR